MTMCEQPNQDSFLTDAESPPQTNDEVNTPNTSLTSFLHRLRQMPAQKQQQLVSTSAAIVSRNTGPPSKTNGNATSQLENCPKEGDVIMREIIYGVKENDRINNKEKQVGMCFVVDAHERRVRLVGKEDFRKQQPRLVHLEDVPDDELARFGTAFSDEKTEITDKYVHCDSCNQYYEFCCFEHPLYQCQDRDPAISSQNSPSKEGDDRASLTLPGFLYIHNSHIPTAGKGVFTKVDIPVGIVFGPYEGILLQDAKKASQDGYSWELRTGNGKSSYYIDAKDARYSNWMRYINSPRHESEQNLIAFQYCGSVFYRVYRPIDKNSELLVWKELWQRTRHHKR